ncbi:Xaa-Pro peptidase family protein [Mesorhizobium sp. M0960]|uniref:M24 family metallopeptidase n=1 Tax=Mesorhizobium sp. M0960 TaxID=2957035 RepID=UPI003337235D
MKVSGVNTASVQKNLAFPIAEFEQRLKAVRQEMSTRQLDMLIVTTPENMYYLTGFDTLGYTSTQFLLVPLDGDPFLITRAIEETNVVISSWTEQRASYMDHESPIELLAETIKSKGYANSIIGVEKISIFLTVANYERLKYLLPSTKFEDGSLTVESARVVKSDLEIDYIRQAARIADAGMEAGLNQVHVGASENDIAAEIQRVVTIMGSDCTSGPPLISSGVRTSYCHATWSGRKIVEGDPVLLELSGNIRRYSAAVMRIAVAKSANPEFARMEDVSRRALEKMIEAIRPDRPMGEVWDVWSRTVTDGGYEGRFKRTGYSIGVNYPPDWGEGYILSFKRGETRTLRPNMTFHIPSMVKVFGFADAGTSETVRVTETGCEILTNVERKIYVR